MWVWQMGKNHTKPTTPQNPKTNQTTTTNQTCAKTSQHWGWISAEEQGDPSLQRHYQSGYLEAGQREYLGWRSTAKACSVSCSVCGSPAWGCSWHPAVAAVKPAGNVLVPAQKGWCCPCRPGKRAQPGGFRCEQGWFKLNTGRWMVNGIFRGILVLF